MDNPIRIYPVVILVNALAKAQRLTEDKAVRTSIPGEAASAAINIALNERRKGYYDFAAKASEAIALINSNLGLAKEVYLSYIRKRKGIEYADEAKEQVSAAYLSAFKSICEAVEGVNFTKRPLPDEKTLMVYDSIMTETRKRRKSDPGFEVSVSEILSALAFYERFSNPLNKEAPFDLQPSFESWQYSSSSKKVCVMDPFTIRSAQNWLISQSNNGRNFHQTLTEELPKKISNAWARVSRISSPASAAKQSSADEVIAILNSAAKQSSDEEVLVIKASSDAAFKMLREILIADYLTSKGMPLGILRANQA